MAGLREKRKIKKWGLFWPGKEEEVGVAGKKKIKTQQGMAGKKIKTQQGLAADPS